MSKNSIFNQAKFVFIVSLALIFLITLFPFRFTSNSDLNLVAVNRLATGLVKINSWQEPVMNIFLFVPFGFGMAGLIVDGRKRPFLTFVRIAAGGLALSLLIESLQLFIFVRTTSVVDLMTNSLGAGCGFLLFHLYGERLLGWVLGVEEWLFSKASVTRLIVLCLVYLIGMVGFWQSWRPRVSLQNWEITFPILIGNEKTGNRPWNGTVSRLYFSDVVLSSEEIEAAFEQGAPALDNLLTLYQLDTENGSFSDQLGYSPAMIQQEQSPHTWWMSSPAILLNAQLKERSQFTIGAVVQTAVISQTGPARIVSLSANPSERNFMLGQEGDDLVIRLRTPATGLNGSDPKFLIPNLFADRQPHHLIVTYDGRLLQVYVDGSKRLPRLRGDRPLTFDLTEVAMAQRLFFVAYTDPVTLPANQTGFWIFKYGLFIIFPLTLFWIAKSMRARKHLNVI